MCFRSVFLLVSFFRIIQILSNRSTAISASCGVGVYSTIWLTQNWLCAAYKVTFRGGALEGICRSSASFYLAIGEPDRQKFLDLASSFEGGRLCVFKLARWQDWANFLIVVFPNLLRIQDRWVKVDIQELSFKIDLSDSSKEYFALIFSFEFKFPNSCENYPVAALMKIGKL